MKKKKKLLSKKNRIHHLYSHLFVRILLISLLLVSIIGFLSDSPHPMHLRNIAPELPQQLVLRITPSATPSIERRTLIPKANAEEPTSTPNYCINAPVLFYHHVEPMPEAEKLGHPQFTVDTAVFDAQMAYLKNNGYKTVAIDTVVDAIRNKRHFPEKTVALTFDDGFADMYSYAYPILRKYGFVGNFAVPTGLVGNDDYLTWEQLTKLADDPMMHIYNHTWSHTELVGATDPQITFEITKPQDDIQRRLGLRSNIFFYPYGEFNEHTMQILRDHGYIAAFSTLSGTHQCESDLMSLHRTRIGNAPLSSYNL